MFEDKMKPKPLNKKKDPYEFSHQSYNKSRMGNRAGTDYGVGYTNPVKYDQEPLPRGIKQFNVDL